MGAEAMLVMASATARRAEAAASSSATGVRSPMAMASPVVDVEAGGGDGRVGHRHLPRARPSGRAQIRPVDGAVADGDEEGLVGHRRQAQHAAHAPRRRSMPGEVERRRGAATGAVAASAASAAACRGAPQRHVDGRGRPKCASSTTSRSSAVAVAHHRERAALAGAERREALQPVRRRPPARSAPAPRCTRSRAATARARRWGSGAAGSARRGRLSWTSSGSALERPPAPTSWMESDGVLGRRAPSSGR